MRINSFNSKSVVEMIILELFPDAKLRKKQAAATAAAAAGDS